MLSGDTSKGKKIVMPLPVFNLLLTVLASSITVYGSCPEREVVNPDFSVTVPTPTVFDCSGSHILPSSICQGTLKKFTLSFWFKGDYDINLFYNDHTCFRMTMDDNGDATTFLSKMFLARFNPNSGLTIDVSIGSQGSGAANVYSTPIHILTSPNPWVFFVFSVDYQNDLGFVSWYEVMANLKNYTDGSLHFDTNLDWKIDSTVKMCFGGDPYLNSFTSYSVKDFNFFPNYYSTKFEEFLFSYPLRIIASFQLYKHRSTGATESKNGITLTSAPCIAPVWDDYEIMKGNWLKTKLQTINPEFDQNFLNWMNVLSLSEIILTWFGLWILPSVSI